MWSNQEKFLDRLTNHEVVIRLPIGISYCHQLVIVNPATMPGLPYCGIYIFVIYERMDPQAHELYHCRISPISSLKGNIIYILSQSVIIT
jgi:hypothetical protein